jgi:hypothetical protein
VPLHTCLAFRVRPRWWPSICVVESMAIIQYPLQSVRSVGDSETIYGSELYAFGRAASSRSGPGFFAIEHSTIYRPQKHLGRPRQGTE